MKDGPVLQSGRLGVVGKKIGITDGVCPELGKVGAKTISQKWRGKCVETRWKNRKN
jgi:hypothetical protein